MNTTRLNYGSLLTLLLLTLVAPVMAQQWEVQTVLPAPDYRVLDVVKFQNRLIVGGKFTAFAPWNGGAAIFDPTTLSP